MKQAVFHPAALVELENSVGFYEARAKGLGGDFAAAVERAVARIIDNPKAAVQMERGIRR